MLPKIIKVPAEKTDISMAVIIDKDEDMTGISGIDAEYLANKLKNETEWIIYKQPRILFFHKPDEKLPFNEMAESARVAGSKFYDALKKEQTGSVQVCGKIQKSLTLSFLEGFLLAAYTFSKYKTEKDDYMPDEIHIADDSIQQHQIDELVHVTEAVYHARNLVNEPLSHLTATKFASEIEKLGKLSGFSVEVFNKKKIESLRMGGLLSVNRGSIDPPTFSVLEWKPENAVNEQPVVLVGKGVVYDTGGLSLKPTAKSMDYMKCDMAGGAVVAATFYAAAKNRIPLHIIGLIPATDNRPDGNAYVPGDIVTMYDGTTVEIKNTDAEGRLLLADALSYVKKFNPGLVIDIATLTGSAGMIAGSQACVGMGNSSENMIKLKDTGDEVYERMIEVPLWKEYAKPLKSDIADLNNLGVREAQTSIAGKFLEHFTGYPWIHLDIAGVAFLHKKESYRPAGGTGFGIRMLSRFLKKIN